MKRVASTFRETDAGNVRVAVLSVIYGLISVIMIFVNKLILSGEKSVSPDALLIIQCAVSAFFVFVGSGFTRNSLHISLRDFGLCSIVNVAFVVAMLANSCTLKYLSIHMVTLLKCCAVVVTALGDRFFFKQEVSPMTWVSLMMIVAGSAIGYVSDLEFSWIGYFWMGLSILFSAGYVLLSKVLVSQRSIPFFTAVFWNNFTGAVLLLVYSIATTRENFSSMFSGVFTKVDNVPYHAPSFILFSGLLGLALNISTFSLLGHASATSYVVVGAGKKIIQAVISYIFFTSTIDLLNVAGVTIGLAGATLYAYIKWRGKPVSAPVRDDSIELLTDAAESTES